MSQKDNVADVESIDSQDSEAAEHVTGFIKREEVLNNIEVKDTLLNILTKMLTENDHQLIANILDQSGKIILSSNDFTLLVSKILSIKGEIVRQHEIKINYKEDVTTSCFKRIISPFKYIISVTYKDKDLHMDELEVYNTLLYDFNISTKRVYIVSSDE